MKKKPLLKGRAPEKVANAEHFFTEKLAFSKMQLF